TVPEGLDTIRWAYTVRLFFQEHRSAPIVSLGLQGCILIDTQGWLVEVPALGGGRNIGHWFIPHAEYATAAEQALYLTIGRVCLYPMCLALSWMQDPATTLTAVDPCRPGRVKPHGRPCARRHYTTVVRRET